MEWRHRTVLNVKLNLDANHFLPVESKDCMNSASYECRNYVGQERGTVCAQGNADYLLENLFCEDHENVVN